jgi:hypothetical protein
VTHNNPVALSTEWPRNDPPGGPCRGPMTCDFPDPAGYRWLATWVCPSCQTAYVRGRRVKHFRWYRRWIAEHGYWRLPLIGVRRGA